MAFPGELAQFSVEAGVLLSDSYDSLNGGYWAVISGRFDTEDEADAHCTALSQLTSSCYSRLISRNPTVHPPDIDPVHSDALPTYQGLAVELLTMCGDAPADLTIQNTGERRVSATSIVVVEAATDVVIWTAEAAMPIIDSQRVETLDLTGALDLPELASYLVRVSGSAEGIPAVTQSAHTCPKFD